MRSAVTTALDFIGALLVIIGVGMIYVPAAVIIAGFALLVASYNRAEADGGKP